MTSDKVRPEGSEPPIRLIDEARTAPRPTPQEPRPTAHGQPPTSHGPRPTSHAQPPTGHAQPPTSDAHAHAFAHEGWGPEAAAFPHERLDAYRVALHMAVLAKKVAGAIPRGHRNVADHMQRSAQNAVLLLAEGANRRTPGEKRQRFGESRGECGEVAATADLVIVMELSPSSDARELKALAARVSAMLTGLLNRLG